MRTPLHFLAAVAVTTLLLPYAAFADSDIHFSPDGTFSAKNLVVMQKVGTNLFCRGTWGEAFIRLVVIPSASTTVIKAHGELATIQDVNEQDLIDVDGALVTGGDSLSINPSVIHDSNLQQESKTLSGAIASIDVSGGTFKLTNKTFGTTTVSVGSTQILKGARTILIGDLVVGDKILSTAGTYDYTSNTLAASFISVYQDASVFAPRNFQGTLKSISGVTLPVTLVVTVGSTDYTVYFLQGSTVLNNAKKAASLTRFVAGDTVRFYGSIRTTNLTEIDSDTLRDLNF